MKSKGTITFKHCGICGKQVKDDQSSTTIPTKITWWNGITVCQMYHTKCYDEERGE